MDSSQAKEKTASKSENGKIAADPFASDIFAADRTAESDELQKNVESEAASPSRIWKLPKARRSTDWTTLRRNLPADFSSDLPRLLADSLAAYLGFEADNPIEFLFLVEREINEINETESQSWWLNIGISNSQAEFAVEIDDLFAVWLVDAAIGGAKSEIAQTREFTPSEIAVLEFLAVNLTHEANKIISAPLFKFNGLSQKIPDWARRIGGDDAENSLLVANWQTVHGFLNSIVKIYVAPDTLKSLDASENRLLNAAPRRAKMWNAPDNRVRDVRARLFLGEVPMTLADAAGIETGDVILPESYEYSIGGSDFSGRAEILLGDGEQVKIVGAFVPSESAPPVEFGEKKGDDDQHKILVSRLPSNGGLRVLINHLEELENPQLPEKSMSNEESETGEFAAGDDSAEFGEGRGISLENLAVTLRVELEARRLSLAEVGNLRINQIIELGASAADPVNLLIDDKVVARGELVEVEDRLGVRIIQILR